MGNQQLQTFVSGEFGALNVLVEDGREYFPATACARILDYSNPQEAIRTHCKGVRKILTPSTGGQQAQNYITEGDLYRLIIRSKLPAAERFETWLFDEVLPSIRRHGAYAPDISAIVAQTAQAVIRELLPYLSPKRDEPRELPKAHRKPTLCLIERFEPQYQNEIDSMLDSNRYTYSEISDYFACRHNLRFSRSSLGRYAYKRNAPINPC